MARPAKAYKAWLISKATGTFRMLTVKGKTSKGSVWVMTGTHQQKIRVPVETHDHVIVFDEYDAGLKIIQLMDEKIEAARDAISGKQAEIEGSMEIKRRVIEDGVHMLQTNEEESHE